MYQENNLTDLIYNFMSLDHEGMFRESMMLSLAYLYGGNNEIQEDFFLNFIDDDENLVITAIRNRMNILWERFKKIEGSRVNYMYTQVQRNLFSFLRGKKATDVIDDNELIKYSSQDISDKYFDDALNSTENRFLVVIFSFLQALCEG